MTELSGVLFGWMTAILVFALGITGAVLANRRIARSGGIQKRGPYPEVRRLTSEGWKFGAAPKPAAAVGRTKTCGRCGKVVALSAHAGDRCPHCGAYWSYEREKVVRR